MKVAALLPVPLVGSGGHKTILRNLAAVAGRGAEVTLFVAPGGQSPAETREILEGLQPLGEMVVRQGIEPDGRFDVGLATAWFTVDQLLAADIERRCYFVQDYEAGFNPLGYEYFRAAATYAAPLDKITIGQWLGHRVRQHFGEGSAATPFGHDAAFYGAGNGRRRGPSLAVLYQPDKPRRGVALLDAALEIVRVARPDVEILLFGSAIGSHPGVGYDPQNLGLLTEHQLRSLYGQSTVGVSISLSNPSRIPFEMMGAGLPVIEVFGQQTCFDLPADTITMAYPAPASLASAMLDLLDDPGRRESQRAAGLDFARRRTLGVETEVFADLLTDPELYSESSGGEIAANRGLRVVVDRSDVTRGAMNVIDAEGRACGLGREELDLVETSIEAPA